MKITQKYLDELTYSILGCAIEVHKQLGPSLLESIHEKCFTRELQLKGLAFKEQTIIPIDYRGLHLNSELRRDVLVEDLIVVELKAIERFAPVHQAIILSYMKMLQKPKGVLINFNSTNIFREGQKTFINEYYASLPFK